MSRNDLIILLIGIFVAILVGGTLALTLLYGEHRRNRLAELGDIDEELKKEYINEHKNGAINVTFKVIETVLVLGFVALFTFVTISKYNGDKFIINNEDVFVVKSGSMSELNPKNPYKDEIVENNWNDRFDVFDMVFVKNKPSNPEQIHYGDVVAYHRDDKLIIHRVVDIWDPKRSGKEYYQFITCGDANSASDGFITFDEIFGVYTKHKIPFMGVFVLWLQSALGYVVLGIIIVYIAYSSYLEKDMDKYTIARLVKIQYLIPYETKFHRIKYKINPNPPKFIKDDDEDDDEEAPIIKGTTRYRRRVYVVTLSRHDIVNVDRLNKYNFETPSKSVYKCHHFHTQRIRCFNTQYVCIKVWFRCNHATIIKYLFFNRVKNFKYRPMALKQVHYLIHSGRLNNYIKLQLDLMEEKNASK